MPKFRILKANRFSEWPEPGRIVEMDWNAAEIPLKERSVELVSEDEECPFEEQEVPAGECTSELILETAKENLELAVDALKKCKIKYVLGFGTVLGLYRDGGFIQGDESDIDIIVTDDYWHKRNELVYRMQEAGFSLYKEFSAEDGIAPELSFFRMAGDVKMKVDIFFFSTDPKDDDTLLFRIYDGDRYITREIPKKLIATTFPRQMYGRNYSTPSAIASYLELNYGKEWKVPVGQDDWDWYRSNRCPERKPKVDMSQVTAVIKTFKRDGYFYECIRSLHETYPDVKIIVCDDNADGVEERKRRTSEYWSKYIVLPYDSGLSVGRNTMVEHVTTPFVLIGDDDFFYEQRTGLEKLVQLMDVADIASGSIEQGGKVLHYEGYIDKRNGRLLYTRVHPLEEWMYSEGVRYKGVDIAYNFALMKTEVAKDVKWDEKIKVAYEHSDFFICAKEKGYTVVYCPDACVLHKPPHVHDGADTDYGDFRDRKTDKERFYTKHGLRYLVDINGVKDRL